ncbi:MAG: hypothetical protein V8R22_00315 [Lachnospiraceae bacterium]
MTTKEMVEKLREFSVPELCDGMEEPRVMDYQVKPLAAGRKIVRDRPIRLILRMVSAELFRRHF